jgi:hypothetical protein
VTSGRKSDCALLCPNANGSAYFTGQQCDAYCNVKDCPDCVFKGPYNTGTATNSTTTVSTPVTCTGDSNWGYQTATPGNKISKTCPDNSLVYATCGTDGKWVNVGTCPVQTNIPVANTLPVPETNTIATYIPDVKYNLINQTSLNRCLDSNGTDIYFSGCQSTNDYQKWNIENGAIKHKVSGKCLDGNGTKFYLSGCQAGNEYQQFKYDSNSGKILHPKTTTFLGGSGSTLTPNSLFQDIPSQNFKII